MRLRKWEDLPENMRTDEVRTYYDMLAGKKMTLVLKRCFDVVISLVLLVILAVPMTVIAVIIKYPVGNNILFIETQTPRSSPAGLRPETDRCNRCLPETAARLKCSNNPHISPKDNKRTAASCAAFHHGTS